MKIQYIAHDIATVLTEYYIRLRMINPSEQKRYVNLSGLQTQDNNNTMCL